MLEQSILKEIVVDLFNDTSKNIIKKALLWLKNFTVTSIFVICLILTIGYALSIYGDYIGSEAFKKCIAEGESVKLCEKYYLED